MPETVTPTPQPGAAPVTPPAPGAQEPQVLPPVVPPEGDDPSWDEKTKAYIKSLRTEAASNRTKAKALEADVAATKTRLENVEKGLKSALGIKDDSTKPEEKIAALATEKEVLEFRSAVLESAVEHGIDKTGLDYYTFLVSQKAQTLKDGEEVTADDLKAIALQVKQMMTKAPATTSVTTPTTPPAPGAPGSVSIDQFVGMTITEKSKLFNSNPEAYKQLMEQAKREKKLR